MNPMKASTAQIVNDYNYEFTAALTGKWAPATLIAAATIESAKALRRIATAVESLEIEMRKLRKQLKTGERRRRLAAKRGWENRRARAAALEVAP